jgi:hypothetical protein
MNTLDFKYQDLLQDILDNGGGENKYLRQTKVLKFIQRC